MVSKAVGYQELSRRDNTKENNAGDDEYLNESVEGCKWLRHMQAISYGEVDKNSIVISLETRNTNHWLD